jgi:hypothetical protein
MITLTPDHAYLVDGQNYPGFSEIAKAMGLVRYFNSDKFFLERGSAIHAATHLIDRGELDWSTVDPRIEPFLEAYMRFKEDHMPYGWEHAEESLHHPTYRYCGTPDRFLPLYDLKSGQGDTIQLEAYSELLRANGHNPGLYGYLLQLNGDGTYKIVRHKYDRKLLGVWLSAVSVYQYRKLKGLL